MIDSFRLIPSNKEVVIVAVSGGSDSLALLFMMLSYCEGKNFRLIAVTVDHGLRAESFHEAQFVADICRRLNVEHHILFWKGDKPITGLCYAARLARYQIIADFAKTNNALVVMLGHTRNDQAETILMREMRGDGLGLAGMASGTLFSNSIWFYRPLMFLDRQDLRSYLQKKGLHWIEDPTNFDLQRERSRLRAELTSSSNYQERVDATCRLGALVAEKRIRLGEIAKEMIQEHVRLIAPGLLHVSFGFFDSSYEGALYGLRILLAITGGSSYLPSRERCDILLQALLKRKGRFTLSRTLVDVKKSGIFFVRELRALPPPVSPKVGNIWDRRYRVIYSKKENKNNQNSFDSISLNISALLSVAQSGQPNFWNKENVSFVPVLAPWEIFLPKFDFSVAQEFAKLFEIGYYPLLPCNGHISLSLS